MEETTSAREGSWGLGDPDGSPNRLQETCVERKGLNSTSGHLGTLYWKFYALSPFIALHVLGSDSILVLSQWLFLLSQAAVKLLDCTFWFDFGGLLPFPTCSFVMPVLELY